MYIYPLKIKNIVLYCIVLVDGSDEAAEWGKAIRRARQKERQIRLNEALSLREFYDEKFKWETQCKILVERMRLLFQ